MKSFAEDPLWLRTGCQTPMPPVALCLLLQYRRCRWSAGGVRQRVILAGLSAANALMATQLIFKSVGTEDLWQSCQSTAVAMNTDA